MTTTLIILGRNNLNKTETYWTLWMWWRMWQKYTTTTLQMMMKVTMTTWMMKTPLPKPKGFDQRLSHRCRSVFVVVFVAFSPKLGDCVCVFGVCVLFSGISFSIGVCVPSSYTGRARIFIQVSLWHYSCSSFPFVSHPQSCWVFRDFL